MGTEITQAKRAIMATRQQFATAHPEYQDFLVDTLASARVTKRKPVIKTPQKKTTAVKSKLAKPLTRSQLRSGWVTERGWVLICLTL